MMIVRPQAEGLLLIPQATHALVAFALARNWGNRTASRPGPLDEVLAAVLVHDGGWDLRQREPLLAPDGTVASFATWPQGSERELLWWDTFAHAQSRGQYVAYLVGRHLLHLAKTYSPGVHLEFQGVMEKKLEEIEQSLKTQSRYLQIFATGQNEVNVRVLRVCDALSLALCQGVTRTTTIPEAPWKTGFSAMQLFPSNSQELRVHPWPFRGRHVVVHVEARFLRDPRPASQEQLLYAFQQAPRQPLVFHLYPLGTAPKG